MTTIRVELIVEDLMNPSNDDARRFVEEIVCEAFGKEERKDHPRLRLLWIKTEHVRSDGL